RHAAKRETAAHPLAYRHYIGLEIELIGRPHRSCPAETSQNLVCDQQCAKFICNFPNGANELIGRDDVARGALHWLKDDCSNFVLRFVLDDVAQMVRASETTGRIFELPGAAIAVCIRR